jgi:hypothetical protein
MLIINIVHWIIVDHGLQCRKYDVVGLTYDIVTLARIQMPFKLLHSLDSFLCLSDALQADSCLSEVSLTVRPPERFLSKAFHHTPAYALEYLDPWVTMILLVISHNCDMICDKGLNHRI